MGTRAHEQDRLLDELLRPAPVSVMTREHPSEDECVVVQWRRIHLDAEVDIEIAVDEAVIKTQLTGPQASTKALLLPIRRKA
jgi:hypothetical protein